MSLSKSILQRASRQEREPLGLEIMGPFASLTDAMGSSAKASAKAGLSRCLGHFPGVYSLRATPVPIPNTEVKPQRAYGTTVICRGRVGLCQGINQDGSPQGEPFLFLGHPSGWPFLFAPLFRLRARPFVSHCQSTQECVPFAEPYSDRRCHASRKSA